MEKSIVSIITCNSYDDEIVFDAVSKAVYYLGGIEKFVSRDEQVLLKPNFLYASDPSKCITTHPAVIKAVIRIMKENGYTKFTCGDSPATSSCKSAFEKMGLDESYMAPMNKEVLKDGFYFTEDVVNADAIIGICKMKTHMLERVTGAVKNMYGLICGFRKPKGHVTYPTAVSFAKMLAGIHKATPQRLHIMDGIMAMEGNGPASGTPVEMDVILASADPIALDACFCWLVHLDPSLVPTETCGHLEGLGTYKENEITILLNGEEISKKELVEKYGNPDFDVERGGHKFTLLGVWDRITNKFANRPVIDPKKCVMCGMCVKHCPVDGHAVNFTKGKANPPEYDYKKCIKCYCCQEICPQHAIYVK